MSYELTIEPLGRSIDVEEGQTILDAALRAGIYLPHACGQGYCATCKVCITDGEVDHGSASNFALMDYEREEGKALACCARLESDMTIEVEMDLDADARDIPVRDFSGVVSRIDTLTPTIKGIWITLDHGATLDFQAGQYVNLHLPHELGHRAFSLASAPSHGNEIELNIRLVPGGAGTSWIHQHLKVGDHATERIADGGHQDHDPELVGIELGIAENRGFGAQRQQGGRNESDQKDGAQPVARQREPLDQTLDEYFHQNESSSGAKSPTARPMSPCGHPLALE